MDRVRAQQQVAASALRRLGCGEVPPVDGAPHVGGTRPGSGTRPEVTDEALECLPHGHAGHGGAVRGGGVRDGVHESRAHQRPGGIMDQDEVRVHGPDAGRDRLLPPRSAGHDRRVLRAHPRFGGQTGHAVGRVHDDHPADGPRRREGIERPCQQRAAEDERRALVEAAHAPPGARRNDDGVGGAGEAHSCPGWAKTIRPATVWRTRVTVTSTSRPR